MNGLLAKFVFSGRTRFFHKLNSLEEIIEDLQTEARAIVTHVADRNPGFSNHTWRELEVLGYDLNSCVGETTIILKSFFCALPPEELEPFRRKLVSLVPALRSADPERK